MKIKDYIILSLVLILLYSYFFRNQDVLILEKETITVDTLLITEPIIHDTIREPIVRYIKQTKDSLVFVSDTNALKVNEYNETIKTNIGSADLNIIVDGEIKKITGSITCNKIVKTVEIIKKIKKKNRNSLFLGGSLNSMNNLQQSQFILNADYQLNNKYLIGLFYTIQNKSIGFKIGFKI